MSFLSTVRNMLRMAVFLQPKSSLPEEQWPEPNEVIRNLSLPYPMPLYFVQHPGGTYSVAEPQPTLRELESNFDNLVSSLFSENAQLKFILSQAPMMDCPSDPLRFGKMVTRFCYVNPNTFAKYTGGFLSGRYSTFGKSPTKWVLTPLIPEGRILLSPDIIPGFESLLAEPACNGK